MLCRVHGPMPGRRRTYGSLRCREDHSDACRHSNNDAKCEDCGNCESGRYDHKNDRQHWHGLGVQLTSICTPQGTSVPRFWWMAAEANRGGLVRRNGRCLWVSTGVRAMGRTWPSRMLDQAMLSVSTTRCVCEDLDTRPISVAMSATTRPA